MVHLGDERSGAQFDDLRMHRYALWRHWADGEGHCMWIGLNPSTADHAKDDPTIRKCCGFAKRWGFGGIYMLNLYTQISTNPKFLIEDGLSSEAADLFRQYATCAGRIVACWGAFRAACAGLWRVQPMLPDGAELSCLGVTQNGAPKHPLYVPYTATCLPYGRVKAG